MTFPSLSFSAGVAFLILKLASRVLAHGQIISVTVDGVQYPGFNTYYLPDENNKKTPVHRLTPNEIGYVRYYDVRNDKMACSEAGFDPVPVTAPVKAGGQVQVQWRGDKGADKQQWPHPSGPVMSYMARCVGPCSSFDVRQAKFFKIEEFGLDTSQRPSEELMALTRADNQPATGEGLWGASKLMQENSLWTVKIPKGIADGEYILRHEIIALQWVANPNDPNSGAQYYPSCIQLSVSGGGSDRPEGVFARDLYTVEDGIFDLYKDGGPKSYKVPGPPLYTSGTASPAPNPAPPPVPAPAPVPQPPASSPPSDPSPPYNEAPSPGKSAPAPPPVNNPPPTCSKKKRSPQSQVMQRKALEDREKLETQSIYSRRMERTKKETVSRSNHYSAGMRRFALSG